MKTITRTVSVAKVSFNIVSETGQLCDNEIAYYGMTDTEIERELKRVYKNCKAVWIDKIEREEQTFSMPLDVFCKNAVIDNRVAMKGGADHE